MYNFSNQTAIITGGSRGIGLAIARSFLISGANVILLARSSANLGQACESLSADLKGWHKEQNNLPDLDIEGRIASYICDMGDQEAIQETASQILKKHKRIDILVNNAGISPFYGSAERMSPQDWDQLVAVNMSGVFHACQAFGKKMIEQESGTILNVSSIAGHKGLHRQAAYSATKGAVELLTKGLAQDWAKYNIRINALAYGFIGTDLTQGLQDNQALKEKLLERIPMRRIGQLEEVAGPALFLASDAASYITGTSLIVDGGWLAS